MEFINVVFAPIVGLIIILIDYHGRRPADISQKRLFTLLISFALAAIVCDIVYFSIEGTQGSFFATANLAASTLYFVFKLLTFSFMLLLCDYIFKGSIARMKVTIIVAGTVNAVNIILLTLNLFTQQWFYFTYDSAYVRGEWYMALIANYYLLVAFMFLNISINRDNVSRDLRFFILASTLPAVIGSMADIIWDRSLIIWPGTFIALLFIYLFIIRASALIDSLTNVYNRRGLDEFLRSIDKPDRRKGYAFVMIDMDRFKEINDRFGHAQGDNALRDAAELLRQSVRRDDFIARYGGDEFMIVAEAGDEGAAEVIVKNITQRFAEFNREEIRPYTLASSCGGDIYRPDDARSLSGFLAHIDALMYAEKERRQG